MAAEPSIAAAAGSIAVFFWCWPCCACDGACLPAVAQLCQPLRVAHYNDGVLPAASGVAAVSEGCSGGWRSGGDHPPGGLNHRCPQGNQLLQKGGLSSWAGKSGLGAQVWGSRDRLAGRQAGKQAGATMSSLQCSLAACLLSLSAPRCPALPADRHPSVGRGGEHERPSPANVFFPVLWPRWGGHHRGGAGSGGRGGRGRR